MTSRTGIVLILAASAAFAQDPAGTTGSLTSALRAKEYEQAVQLARSALKQSPNDPRILTLEGIALSGLAKDRDALTAYDAALKISPDYLPALEGAAQLEYKAGSSRAVPLLNHILKLRPNDPTSHAMLAVLAYQRHDCETAIKHFAASGELVSSQPDALAQYGDCLVRLKQPENAVPVFERLVALNSSDDRARLRLAIVQFLARHSQDAIETLQPLLAAKDPSPNALDLASEAYEDTGDTPRAVSLLRQAIISSPKNPNYYLDFATLSFTHSSFQVGIDVLNAGLTRLPKSAPLYLARGILYIQLAQYDKGEADFEAADRLDPKQVFGSDAQGLAQFEQNDLDHALVTVRAQLKTHPADAFLHYLLAEILMQQGAMPGSPEFKDAVQAAAKAVQLKPDLIVARDVLGGLYLKSGQAAQAVEESRAALRADPTDQSALYHLVQALRGTDKKDELPALLKRLAALREQSQQSETAQNHYKLVEPAQPPPSTRPSQPNKP